MKCTDNSATIYADGAIFSLDSNEEEYTVERWDKKAIVASDVAGICRVRNVIKFDLEQKRIYFMQALSEPTEDLPKLSQDTCKFANMHLELKDSAMWKR
jgi:hypothetical protein